MMSGGGTDEVGSLGRVWVLRFLGGTGESTSSSTSCDVWWERERGRTREDSGGMTTFGRGRDFGAEDLDVLRVGGPGGSDFVGGTEGSEGRDGCAGRERGGREGGGFEACSHLNLRYTHKLQATRRPVVCEMIQATESWTHREQGS